MPKVDTTLAPPPRRRRTTYVSEQDWRAFAEVKAGIMGRKGESAVARELARLGLPALHNVILPVARGVTQVDHIVRGLDAIVVIETKTYGGVITGTVESREWVQHLAGGQTRHAFKNPVLQNARHCRAVEEVLRGLEVSVQGAIVSAGRARLCDELTTVVVPVDRMSGMFMWTASGGTDPVMLEAAWLRLITAAAAAEARREEHGAAVRRRRA